MSVKIFKTTLESPFSKLILYRDGLVGNMGTRTLTIFEVMAVQVMFNFDDVKLVIYMWLVRRITFH